MASLNDLFETADLEVGETKDRDTCRSYGFHLELNIQPQAIYATIHPEAICILISCLFSCLSLFYLI